MSHVRRFFCGFLPARKLDSHRGSVELGECEASEFLAKSRTLITKDTDRNRLAEKQSLVVIGAPVDASEVATHSDIAGQLVEFVGDRHLPDIRPLVGNQRKTVVRLPVSNIECR